jgi:hypothetical protein
MRGNFMADLSTIDDCLSPRRGSWVLSNERAPAHSIPFFKNTHMPGSPPACEGSDRMISWYHRGGERLWPSL